VAAWIETELKLGLPDAHAWEAIRTCLGPGSVVEQTNHFFSDAADRIRRSAIGVRLRAEEYRGPEADPALSFRLTVKRRASAPDGAPRGPDDRGGDLVARRIELETELTPAVFRESLRSGLLIRPWIDTWRAALRKQPEPGVADLLDDLAEAAGAAPLRRWGGFANRRERLALQLEDDQGMLPITLELDRTELPGGRVDYEIEVEDDGVLDPDLVRTRPALLAWLERELGIVPFAVTSKLARVEAILGRPDPRSSSGPAD
jgi:hypothetical protein